MKGNVNKTVNVRINLTSRCVQVTIFSHGKTISIARSVCVCVSVALVIQDAKRKLCIMLSSVACRLYHNFKHYITNGTIFGK